MLAVKAVGRAEANEISHFSPVLHTTFLLRIHTNRLCMIKDNLLYKSHTSIKKWKISIIMTMRTPA